MESTLLAASMGLAFAVPAFAQNTWYVDGAGTPPGSGTQLDPYTSLQYAIDRPTTLAGDLLLVAPGTYDESVLVQERLTIHATAGPLATTIRGTPGSGTPVVRLAAFDDAPELRLEGFTLTPGDSAPQIGVLGQGGTISNCIVRGFHGPFASGATVLYDLYVESSIVSDNQHGLDAPAFTQLFVFDSICWGNAVDLAASSAAFAQVDYSAGFSGGLLGVAGAHDVLGDPQWWDGQHADFHLRPGSPCIGAGASGSDIGPFAFDPAYAPPPSAYCTAKTNSVGCVPAIGAFGSASATAPNPFVVTCTNELNQRSGLLFYGFAANDVAYQGGWLCVHAPVRRTTLQNSGGNPPPDDCSGSYAFDFNACIQSGSDPALVPGALVSCQYWSRDPAASFQTNRSDALSFGIAP